MEKKLKTINIKADNSPTTKHRRQILNMNAVLIIKYSSIALLGKRKLCECDFFLKLNFENLTLKQYFV